MFQLCLAVADLAVQMPQWLNPVKDLVERFVETDCNFDW